MRTAAGADNQGEIWGGGASWLPLGVTRQMAVPHVLVVRTQSPDGQEKGSKLVLPNPDGLGAELPLPHVLINFWCWVTGPKDPT